MASVRHLLIQHRALAIWLVTLTLFMKVLVPTGYMFGTAHGVVSVELCPAYDAPEPMVMPGGEHHSDKGEHGKPEMPCAFAGLATPSLSGADPLLLAVAIAFIVRTGFRIAVETEPVGSRLHVRPPLRGPPQNA